MHIHQLASPITTVSTRTHFWSPLPTLYAKAIHLADQWYGGRAADEWHHARYHVWNSSRYVGTMQQYEQYLLIYESLARHTDIDLQKLSIETLNSLLRGHGLTERQSHTIAHHFIHLFRGVPFIPLLEKPEKQKDFQLIDKEQRDLLVWLSTLISRHYYFGPPTEHDTDQRTHHLKKYPFLHTTKDGQTIRQLLTMGMVLLAYEDPAVSISLIERYGELTKRRCIYYPSTNPPIKERMYDVELPDGSIIVVSNRLLTPLSFANNILVINNAEEIEPELMTLFAALFAGETICIDGIPLQIPKPPMVVGMTPRKQLGYLCNETTDTLTIAEYSLLVC